MSNLIPWDKADDNTQQQISDIIIKYGIYTFGKYATKLSDVIGATMRYKNFVDLYGAEIYEEANKGFWNSICQKDRLFIQNKITELGVDWKSISEE